jgi:hypothetical protein
MAAFGLLQERGRVFGHGRERQTVKADGRDFQVMDFFTGKCLA